MACGRQRRAACRPSAPPSPGFLSPRRPISLPVALLDRERLERRLEAGDLAAWKATRYRTFRETMTDETAPYPCYFAVEAQREGYFRYVFVDSPTDEDALADLVDRLAEFLDGYSP